MGVREGGGGLRATMTTDTCAVAETLSCHKLCPGERGAGSWAAPLGVRLFQFLFSASDE